MFPGPPCGGWQLQTHTRPHTHTATHTHTHTHGHTHTPVQVHIPILANNFCSSKSSQYLVIIYSQCSDLTFHNKNKALYPDMHIRSPLLSLLDLCCYVLRCYTRFSHPTTSKHCYSFELYRSHVQRNHWKHKKRKIFMLILFTLIMNIIYSTLFLIYSKS